VSRRKPKTLAQAAQHYAEHVWKKLQEVDTPMSEMKLELAMAYMAGALSQLATPAQKEIV
jgi:hypothetical protein